MAIKVMAAASTSAHYHIALAYGAPNQAYSVSTGLANSRTLCIPVHSDNIRFSFNGTFGSTSASSQVIIELCGDNSGGTWFPILTVSAPQTTVLPLQVEHLIRLRHQWTSAAVGPIGSSVDCWIG